MAEDKQQEKIPSRPLLNVSGVIDDFPRPSAVVSSNLTTPGRKLTPDEIWDRTVQSLKPSTSRPAIPYSSFYTGSRYPSSMPGVDTEEEFARQQEIGRAHV